jgi:hypothetical protein
VNGVSSFPSQLAGCKLAATNGVVWFGLPYHTLGMTHPLRTIPTLQVHRPSVMVVAQTALPEIEEITPAEDEAPATEEGGECPAAEVEAPPTFEEPPSPSHRAAPALAAVAEGEEEEEEEEDEEEGEAQAETGQEDADSSTVLLTSEGVELIAEDPFPADDESSSLGDMTSRTLSISDAPSRTTSLSDLPPMEEPSSPTSGSGSPKPQRRGTAYTNLLGPAAKRPNFLPPPSAFQADAGLGLGPGTSGMTQRYDFLPESARQTTLLRCAKVRRRLRWAKGIVFRPESYLRGRRLN